MIKNVTKIAAFAAGVIIIIMLLDIPFRGGDWYLRGYLADRDARIAGIQEEPEGQIDVLNVGDSLANVAITPPEMYRDYGITSYTMGRDLQKCIETYYAIKLASRNQKIKVVLWEVHNMCKHQRGYDPYIIGISEYTKYRSQFIKYHYVWKNLWEEKSIRKYFKGYVVSEKVVPYEKDVPYFDLSKTEAYDVPSDQKYVFKKVYDLCQKEGIQLVLYAVPSPHCYSMRMHNGYVKLAEEYGLPFLDGNIDYEKIGIDFAADYQDDDGDHLNLSGTRKMTKYLAEHLVKECGLTDHRNDPAYRSWEDLMPAYEQEVRDMEGTCYPDIEKERDQEEAPPPGGIGKRNGSGGRSRAGKRKGPGNRSSRKGYNRDLHAIQSRQIRK